MPDKSPLAQLALRVGNFHITDRAMRRAQDAIEEALDAGNADETAGRAYLDSVRRYFDGFSSEARRHLREIDHRLEEVNQVHFNLIAERSVAVKRIEAIEAILRTAIEIEGP
ncbi:MAG: hypothetical protein JO302_06170 [Candidatus Eremiobacteraeota bacterium]|nr:hypothetical protein [Candidatus Eremiobacteraeota bacterium]